MDLEYFDSQFKFHREVCIGYMRPTIINMNNWKHNTPIMSRTKLSYDHLLESYRMINYIKEIENEE